MKIDPIYCPKDKDPRDFLAELGDQTKNAWIYVSDGFYSNLCATCSSFGSLNASKHLKLKWYLYDNETTIIIKFVTVDSCLWNEITSIHSKDIAFKEKSPNPTDILFIKMEDEK